MNKKVLFVGSFLGKTKSGGFGGQMYACNTLVNSSLSDDIEWVKIDTTAKTNLKISIFKKIYNASIRLSKFLLYILFKKFDYILIFSSNGLSFLEKGLMAIISSKLTNAKIIFAPRSGRLKTEIQTYKVEFIKVVFKNADLVICQGRSWMKLFKEKVYDDSNKYIIQKNWIDISLYNFTQKKNDTTIGILFLASLERDKGVFDLVNAADYLVKKGITNFIFNIAGRGKHEKELITQVSKFKLNNYFEFHGWVEGDKKRELFNMNNIFVLPSYFEGMPNALLESMASGLACIASNIDSICDVINLKNGITFNRKCDIDFKLKLEKLILSKSLQKELSINAQLYIQKEHSLNMAINNFRKNIFN